MARNAYTRQGGNGTCRAPQGENVRPIHRLTLSIAAMAVLLGASGSCASSTTATAAPGSLQVEIGGIPEGGSAAVIVTGPAAYRRDLIASATLTDLEPGTYTLTAASVATDAESGILSPSPAHQSAHVRSGATRVVRISYAALRLAVDTIAGGLASPVYLTAPAGDARIFVVEQPGRIRILRDGVLSATPFLDITSRVRSGGEEGLLSVAFDPAFATNGYFFVYFTNLDGDNTIERFSAAPGADVANATPAPVLTIPHPTYGNHNGGLIMFGPDGMLYIGTGDGGGGGDPFRNGQNPKTLLGKLLRLDVRTLPYAIPSTNPFAADTGKRGEIWALGLRNPWRFDFSASSGATGEPLLYIADVGQNAWEEIDVAAAGAAAINYGWNVMEGAHCYNATTCDQTGLRLPVVEYNHTNGCSITGGFVYRGSELPELTGHYFYSDFCRGWLASLSGNPQSGFRTHAWDMPALGNVLSFGEDASGELYILTAAGRVLKLIRR